jgi:hypothetical protein
MASVFSNSYITIAELGKEDFERICKRHQFILKQMEKRMSKKYDNKWKRFIKTSLKGIDYKL